MSKTTNYVDGPFNSVRLVGSIGSIEKVIYLFSDIHYSPEYQSKCADFHSTDVVKYLASNFATISSQSNKTYDFIMETRPGDYSTISEKKIDNRYISRIEKFIRQITKINLKTNKVMPLDYFNNIRIHFSDIRYIIEIVMINIENINNALDYYDGKTADNLINLFVTFIELTKTHVNILDKYINTSAKFNQKIKTFDYDMSDKSSMMLYFEYYISKLTNNYKHPEVKSVVLEMLKIFKSLLEENISTTHKLIDLVKLDKQIVINPDDLQIEEFADEKIYKFGGFNIYNKININNKYSNVYNKCTIAYAILMDSYFIRRICDKDYITNIIMYGGGSHINNYIYFLCHKFGFKLTHCANCKSNKISEINKEIMSHNLDNMCEITFPDKINQCSDMSSFPKNFN